jgi:hypothetical protein
MEKDNHIPVTSKLTNEDYIQYVIEKMGVSREEVLDVARKAGVSVWKIAECLQKEEGEQFEKED